MNKIWQYISAFLAGALTVALFFKPKEITNISNDVKIKNNKAPISDIEVKTDIIQPKEKKRFRLFKKRKK